MQTALGTHKLSWDSHARGMNNTALATTYNLSHQTAQTWQSFKAFSNINYEIDLLSHEIVKIGLLLIEIDLLNLEIGKKKKKKK